MGRKQHPLAARIKRIMQTDEDVGKIAAATPLLICKSLELFLKDVCENVGSIAAEHSARTAGPSHLKEYIVNEHKMDFLKDKVASVASLKEAPGTPPKKKHKVDAELRPAGAAAGPGRGRARTAFDLPAAHSLAGPSSVAASSFAGPPALSNAAAQDGAHPSGFDREPRLKTEPAHDSNCALEAGVGGGHAQPSAIGVGAGHDAGVGVRKPTATAGGGLRGSFSALRKKPSFLARALSGSAGDVGGKQSADGVGPALKAERVTESKPVLAERAAPSVHVSQSILMAQPSATLAHAAEEDDYDAD